jgi:lipoprotein NlpI
VDCPPYRARLTLWRKIFLSRAAGRNGSIPHQQNNFGMNAYLFAASVTRFRTSEPSPAHGAAANQRQIWTSGVSLIVCAENAEEARKRFEKWSCAMPEGESGLECRINKISAAQFVDQLLTETESVPADWPQIAQQAQADMESTAADEVEQGYWLDVNGVIPPSATLDDLRRELPEDISSGLNWATEKQFFFLLSVLSPLPPPASEEWEEPEGGDKEDAQSSEEAAEAPDPASAEALAEFPQLADKEAAALIRARNSAVAAWLWQKYAAETRLAGNQVRIDPWCGVMFPGAILDPDAAIAECDKALESNPNDAYGVYYNRGKAKHAKGDYDGAIADCNMAIELKPDYGNAYIGRGAARYRKWDLEGAIADYSKAIELDPNNANAYHARGCLRYDTQKFEDALADFRKVLELDDSVKDYACFRIWLIRARSGEADAASAELQTYLDSRASGKQDDWESKIGRFLNGQIAEPEFLAAAKNADSRTEAGQLCQAYFYAGSKRLFTGDKATATDYFQKSIATDQKDYTEYSSAAAELKGGNL